MLFSKQNSHILISLLITLLILVNYSNTLRHPFILDDELLVRKNFLIRDWRLVPQIFQTDLTIGVKKEANFYRPLQTLSYLIDCQIWRLNPLGYHLSNILLFVINCLIIYYLIFLIAKDFLIAALSALLFASHPIYCEVVTYISGRAEVLMGIFLAVSLILFIRYTDFSGRLKTVFYLLSLLAFILALLAKELAVILPLALILYDFCYQRDNLSRFKSFFKRHLPFIMVAVFYIVLRLTVLQFSDRLPATANFPLMRRFLIAIANFNLYFGMLAYPFGLHMSRTFLTPATFRDLYVVCGTVSLAIITAGLFWASKSKRGLFFWGAWFFLWLIPQSGIFPINSFLAEHFIYLSAVGFFVIIVTAISQALPRKVSLCLVVPCILIFSFGTIEHNRNWQNEEVFYKNILKYSPQSWLAHVNLGNFYLNQRSYDLAKKEYLAALKLQPTLLIAHSNLALVYLGQDQPEEAIVEIGKSLGRDNIITAEGKVRFPSRKEYLKVIRKDLDIVNIYNGLGMLFCQYKLYDLAKLSFEEALKLGPDYADAHWNMGLFYWQMKEYELARKEWELTLQLDPANLYVREWLARTKSDK